MTCPYRFHILLIAVVVGLKLVRRMRPGQHYGQDTSATAPTGPRAAMLAWRTDGGQDRTSAIFKNFADMGAAGAATDITGIKGSLHITSSSLRNVVTGWVAVSRGSAYRNAFMCSRFRWR